ncbi:radical SAM protein [Zavarzinella formosa]|uniref:radical SAM protein n=1 Tax=Zavarzinella formosa TaxID=360055 RepID=UPI001EE684D2|nr:radical SAM protein [Zavarzinella formosa]
MDRCNQSCGFCAYRLEGYSSNRLFGLPMADGTRDNNPNRSIPWVKLREIVDDCRDMGVRAIQLTGGGEPTLHPHFDDLCRLIFDSGIELAVVTNGLLLKPRRAEWLSAHATWIRVSLDAGSAATYAAVRRVPIREHDIVTANVRHLCGVSNRRATVGIGFVITLENHLEVAMTARLAKDLGADNIRISAFFQNEGADYYERHGIAMAINAQCSQAGELNDKGFRVFNNFGSRHSDLAQGPPDYETCGYMHFTTYVGGDQQLYTCCVNAYNPAGLIGSIRDQSLKSLWDSSAKQTMFEQFRATGCPRCMYNEKNRSIAMMVAEPRSHECFV